ncbi:LysM peptidoglycan-binding domain-containing protein [Streptomyces sp. NBC_00687]|uniref:LysM peptidoglycan-binding domain-containing protein n=1 Tax=Streptomyces sp. NBC_00687 TaxID=2975807 RepID=UPI002257665C|nr:LysM peptidoglycan-binding domain-containing protein [Streptomyces sp. NBC_00687]MCX4919908.1 LysM peptidoglycan-binding domain-containing protein [Streptomyces sp. NBC_00687]
MTNSPFPAANAGRAAYRILKAVISLLALAAAVAGLPYLLAWATPVIWAATHDDLTHLLDRQDTGAVVLLLLAAVGWIGWAQFTFCAIRELIAQLRGRTWRAPRGLGASQRAAALLIGSILVLLPTGTALASDAQATPAATAAHQSGQPARSPQVTSAPSSLTSTTSAPSAAAPTTYTVKETRPAESLWGIAERELGDGERWREIAALNQSRTMADGDTFQSSSFLQPGWQLLMPDTSVPEDGIRTQQATTRASETAQPEHVARVRPGDSLSKIAEKELGDGGDWPALFEASRGTPQPDGLPPITDPDVIYAGQQVTVPGAGANEQPSSADHAPGHSEESAPPAGHAPRNGQEPDSTPTSAQKPGAPAPASSAPTTPDRTTSDQQAPGRGASSSMPSPAASSTPTASAAPQASGSAGLSPAAAAKDPSATADRPPGLRTVLGAGALLAAAITAALALRRALQRRRREPGQKIAIAAETSPAEALLAAAAEPGGAVRLDLALRTMAHHLSQDETPVSPPSLRAARIGSRTVQVLPEDLALEPYTPFVSGTGGWWTLSANAALLDEDAARDVPAPYPGLVTIGSAEDGDLVLVDLARVPALLLDGNPVNITEVCTSLALELGMSPWAGEVEVVAVGFGDDLPQLLPTARIAHMRQPAHALRDVGERLLEAHQMPETSRQPYLLLCSAVLDPDAAWGFADIIDKAGPVPVTLVAPASSAAAHFPEAEILNASLNTPQRLESVGTDITVQRLDHASYLQITTALKVSAQPAHPAEGSWRDVPAEPDHVQQPDVDGETAYDPAVLATVAPAEEDALDDAFPALLAATTSPSASPLASCAPWAEAGADRPPSTAAPDAVPAENSNVPARDDGSGSGAVADSDPGPRDGQAPRAPEIRVLGPVTVTGVDSNGHGPRIAQLATLLYFRPGRSAHIVCSDMDPVSPWTLSTLHARLRGLRRALGNNPDGIPYVPRRKAAEDPYHLSPGVRCDWTRFEELVERALPLGQVGLHGLEEALALVQGPPFAGKPLPWAEPYQQEMITRIIDVAHTVATYLTPAGPHQDLTAARRAVASGLDVDNTAELLYRDWLRIEHAAGNRQGLLTAIARVQQVNRALDFSLELETEHLINELLDRTGTAGRSTKPGIATGAASFR